MELEVAAWGWLGEAWAESYPDDLPEEWRLDYLSNARDAVVVPEADWRKQPPQTLLQWLQEAPAGFRFFWEVATTSPEPLLALYRQSGGAERPGDWLLRGGDEPWLASLRPLGPAVHLAADSASDGELIVLRPEPESDLRELRRQLDALAASGGRRVLLLVLPSPEAAQWLSQLHTFCQLYRG